jgi:ATP-dependent DNA helicase RecQ
MIDYVESHRCRRQTLLGHFGQSHPGNCGSCDRCRPELGNDEQMSGLDSRTRRRDRTPLVLPVPRTALPVKATEQIAERILSHFARIKSPVPVGLAAEGLRGIRSLAILSQDHQSLSTFAILSARSEEEVRHWITQLQMTGNLRRTEGGNGTDPILTLTPAGWDTMTGKRSVVLTYLPLPSQEPESDSWEGSRQSAESEEATFEKLRQWRHLEAVSQKVPAFIILNDSVLRTIARTQPRTMEQLGMVPGIGQKRLERYGAEILEVLRMTG